MPLQTLEQLRSGELTGSRRLKLACGLSEFPREIFDLAETLEVLDLSGNSLVSLPDDLPRLSKLKILFCSDNHFAELPAVLGLCAELEMVGFKANQIRSVPAASLPKKLRWLILTDNQISAFPAEVGQCTRLQKLMLAGNCLTALPDSLANCRRLELLRIAANRLAVLPDWLLTLPRLAWLAYAGNPFCTTLEISSRNRTSIPFIGWEDLQVGRRLGEGASGVIHQAEWRSADSTRPVALKLFKGDMTSDGLPLNEMNACISAGSHPNLIPVLGRIVRHPEEAHGLIMSLIDPQFCNLAGPPSLDSCTRDVYAAELRFDLKTSLCIAHGIASAAGHLHAQGITHGDLYAHNILLGPCGEALLGDFGAASFIVQDDPEIANALAAIEVRAFSCLLEELLERSEIVTVDEQNAWKILADLQAECAQETVSDRPSLAWIVKVLEGLMRG